MFPVPKKSKIIKDPNTGSEYGFEGLFKSDLVETSYFILCFRKNNSNNHPGAITLEYNNYWFEEKLNKILKEHPFEFDGPEWIACEEMREFYGTKFNYNSSFDRSKANLNDANIKDIISDDDYVKIGEEYIDELEKYGEVTRNREPDYDDFKDL